MKNLKWIVKKQQQRLSKADVTITTSKNGTQFIFRNNCFMRITKGEFLKTAIDGNRIYFDAADDVTGYKLSTKKAQNNKYVAFSKRLDRFVGDYNLLWDSKEGYYYISTDGKENFKNV